MIALDWIATPYVLMIFLVVAIAMIVGYFVFGHQKTLGNWTNAYQSLIENMGDGVLVLDHQNHIVLINPAALHLLNCTLESVKSKPIETVLTSWNEWARQFTNLPQTQIEWVISETPPRYIDLRISLLQNKRQVAIGRLVVMRDVTEFKSIEQSHRQRIMELTTINTITQALAEQTDLAEMIQTAGDTVRQILNAQGFYIALYDPHQQLIRFPYWRTLLQQFQIAPSRLGEGLMSLIIKSRQPLLINQDYESRSAALGVVRPLGKRALGLPRSWLGVPMIVNEQIIGVISIQNFETENAFSETDLQLWTTIAAALGTAIRNAQLMDQTRRTAVQMTALNQLSLAITEGLEMERLLPTLHEQCKLIAPIDVFYVALYDANTQERRFAYFFDRGEFRTLPPSDIRTTPGLTGYIINTRQTLFIADTLDPNQPPPVLLVHTSDVPTRTFLGAPLIVHDQVVGVISMQSYTQNAYTLEQIHLFEMFAVQAAIVVQNSRLYAQVQNLATLDELTQLPNRRILFEKGEAKLMRARRFNHPLAVMMLDIDHFKLVNDQYGHATGDFVLRSIADTLHQNIRATDTGARYGGEEFAILLPETDEQVVSQVAERVRAAIADLVIPIANTTLHVTVSLGIANLDQTTQDFGKLIACADQALYQSKQNGRNRVTLWTHKTL